MALQGLQVGMGSLMTQFRATGLARSSVTFQENLSTTVDGTPGQTWTNVSGMVGLNCMRGALPTGGNHTSADKMKTIEDIMSIQPYLVLMDDYYPTIVDTYRAVIDGVPYQIWGVESDSQIQMTHFLAKVITV